MRSADTFSEYHPMVNFMFFSAVIAFAMVFMHPVCLVVSFVGALIYSVYLKGAEKIKRMFKFLLPMMLIAAVINPAFNHEGATILTYLPSGNPLTLESILFGICSSIMLLSVMLWFVCFTEVVTSDKFIYLFGKMIPVLSLILSMALRFVPRYKTQFGVIRQSQKSIGCDISDGEYISIIKNAVNVFSVMVTWALENAIETADSMKSRGYGLPGRTAFSIYRFEKRDRYAFVWMGFCVFYILCGFFAGGMKWTYYPNIYSAEFTPFTVSFYIILLLFYVTPLVINRWEDKKWKHLKYET